MKLIWYWCCLQIRQSAIVVVGGRGGPGGWVGLSGVVPLPSFNSVVVGPSKKHRMGELTSGEVQVSLYRGI